MLQIIVAQAATLVAYKRIGQMDAFLRLPFIAVISVGTLTLVGWALDDPALKSIFPHWLSMKAATALTFILAGISLLLQSKKYLSQSKQCRATENELRARNLQLEAQMQARTLQLADAMDELQRETIDHRHAENALRATEETLKDYAERLKNLTRQLISAQELERRRIARELHDEVGQALTAIRLNVDLARRESSVAAVTPKLDECSRVADHLLDQVRNLSLDLRPAQLDDLGLVAALRSWVNRWANNAGLDVHFTVHPSYFRLSETTETACFRIAQEALTNIVRHAKAREVWVALEADDELRLSIRDDGKGFDVGTARTKASNGASMGLLGMEERATLLGGRFAITSAGSEGTEIKATFPLDAMLTK